MSKKYNNISNKFSKSRCCGCEVCVDICPTQAIKIVEDKEGFRYAKVDKEKCINCGKCIKVCPMRNIQKDEKNYQEPLAYAVKHSNENIRMKSRSGGIFTALSDTVLENDGVVYGCILNEKFEAVHVRCDNKADRDKMRGSKYVQSLMPHITNMIIKDLKDKKTVLFTGTGCQVQGVKQAVPDNLREKLFLVDIVCHGVPSPKVWKDYLKYMEDKYNGKATNVDFRNKKEYGWNSHVETIEINGKSYDSEIYKNMFYNHVILRPSCFECPYKKINRDSDITIADFWGIDNAVKNFNDNKGVSLVLINSDKGKKYFEISKNDLTLEKVELNKCIQPPLKENYILPSNRKKFWNIYNTKGIERAIKEFGVKRKETIMDKVKRKILYR